MRILLLITILLITSGCNKKVKEAVGISTPGPNEYQVQRSKALEVPPHYYLPTPGSLEDTSYNKVNSSKNFNDGEKALLEEMGE